MQYVILLVGFFVALAVLGIDTTKFTILAGAFGVGLGFGLQNIFNNFVSGLIVLFERPVKVGDVIQMNDASGVVKRIGIRASIISTPDGSDIIVPNGKLISDSVTNWTFSSSRRSFVIKLGTAYGTDPRCVIELLQAIAATHSLVIADPSPQAMFVGFGADSLNFELRVWMDNSEEWAQIRSDLSISINTAFIEKNISMPYPQRDLHLRSIDPEALEVIVNHNSGQTNSSASPVSDDTTKEHHA
ncbi:MAG: mechanosensitive ion channel domain-containing protein [Pyrinomonadaceae bacterium]